PGSSRVDCASYRTVEPSPVPCRCRARTQTTHTSERAMQTSAGPAWRELYVPETSAACQTSSWSRSRRHVHEVASDPASPGSKEKHGVSGFGRGIVRTDKLGGAHGTNSVRCPWYGTGRYFGCRARTRSATDAANRH